MNDLAQQAAHDFLEAISPWEEAYSHSTFSFLAVRREGNLVLLQGRLFLQTSSGNVPAKIFNSPNIVAGNFRLEELGLSHTELLDLLQQAKELITPIGALRFPVDEQSGISAFFTAFHQAGLSESNRLPVLTLSGAQRHGLIRQPEIDWELASGVTPYDSLSELLNEFSLGGEMRDFAIVEVVAHTVAIVDLDAKVQGNSAEPAIFLPISAKTEKAKINYRVMLHGNVVGRGSLFGDALTWTADSSRRRGSGKVEIQSGAVVQCFAIYADHLHHKGWIGDPSLFQNSRRAAFEEFDQNQVVMRDFLFESRRARKDARDFEVGIAWLLWMLGFSVVHAGATSRTSDAADILATTPAGHTAIVECTVGHLKVDSKLSKLVERSKTIRKRLNDSGNSHLKILPVIVTALSRDEVKADLDQARGLGVAVITKEDLLSAINQTIMQRNAEEIFTEVEATAQSPQLNFGY